MKNYIKKIAVLSIVLININYAHVTNERAYSVSSQQNIITLPSGLKIEILEHSKNKDAKKPHVGKKVTVHYTGWLMTPDGQKGAKFDSSYDRNMPFSFILGVGQVIKGWDEGIAQLVVGDKARLIIPAELGYGNRSVGNIIRANSILIFDVELISAA